VAGAAIPKATNPTVPSKNFFIVSIPIVMRAVGRPGFVGWAKDPRAAPAVGITQEMMKRLRSLPTLRS
jgi:hypothetical protein